MIPTPLIGHQTLQAQLAGMLEAGTLPHALLLHGPQGVGKRLLAQHLAYRLMCGPAEAEPEGMFGPAAPASPLAYNSASPVAHQLAAGSCPDFYVLEPEDGRKSTGIRQARELLGNLQRSADTARVVIVDALEDLTDEAANALLKTLEEPRPNLTFVLVCHQLSATLPTIRSRCRLLRVHALSEDETRKVLRAQEGDDDLAPQAHGCPGQMLGTAAKTLRDTMQALRPLLEGKSVKAPTMAQAPHVPDALLALLASQRDNATHAKAYGELQTLKRKSAAMNMPSLLVAEAAMALVRG